MHFFLFRSVAALIPNLSSHFKKVSLLFTDTSAFDCLSQHVLLLSNVVPNIFILTRHPVLYFTLYVHLFSLVA